MSYKSATTQRSSLDAYLLTSAVFQARWAPKHEGDRQTEATHYTNDLAPWSRYETALGLNYPSARSIFG